MPIRSKILMTDLPRKGELVVGRVVEIQDHGIYVEIENIPYKGKRVYVYVTEVYPGRIKNIRHHVSINQRVVVRIRRVDPKTGYIEGSIKRVSERDKKAALAEFRREKRLYNIINYIVKKIKEETGQEVSVEELEEKLLKQVKRKRGNLLKGLELIGAGGEATLRSLGIPEERVKPIMEVLKELSVKRELYNVRVKLQLTSLAPDGVERIKQAFMSVREVEIPEDIEIRMYTEGAPKYVIDLKGPDIKALRRLSQELANRVIKRMRELGGEGKIVRER